MAGERWLAVGGSVCCGREGDCLNCDLGGFRGLTAVAGVV